jgi:hypothetical protein
MENEEDNEFRFSVGAGHTVDPAGTVGGTGSASLLNDRRL